MQPVILSPARATGCNSDELWGNKDEQRTNFELGNLQVRKRMNKTKPKDAAIRRTGCRGRDSSEGVTPLHSTNRLSATIVWLSAIPTRCFVIGTNFNRFRWQNCEFTKFVVAAVSIKILAVQLLILPIITNECDFLIEGLIVLILHADWTFIGLFVRRPSFIRLALHIFPTQPRFVLPFPY